MDNKLVTRIQKLIDKYKNQYRNSLLKQIGVTDVKQLNYLRNKSQNLREKINNLKRLQHFVKVNTCKHPALFLWEENDDQLWTCQCLECEKIKLIRSNKYSNQVIKTTKKDKSGDRLYRDYQKIKNEYQLLESETEVKQFIKKYNSKNN